jgi:hypothetical protein
MDRELVELVSEQMPKYEIPKQHCGLMIVDTPERVDELYEQFGFNGTKFIQIAHGTLWDRAMYRNEHSEDIHVVVMDLIDINELHRFGPPSLAWVESCIRNIFARYYCRDEKYLAAEGDERISLMRRQNGGKNIDTEFDIVAMGTKDFIYKHKHRGVGGPAQVFVTKPYPNQTTD